MQMEMGQIINWKTTKTNWLFVEVDNSPLWLFVSYLIACFTLSLISQLISQKRLLKNIKHNLAQSVETRPQKETTNKMNKSSKNNEVSFELESRNQEIKKEKILISDKELAECKLSHLRKQFLLIKFCIYFVHGLLTISIMLLAMSFNGYVIISFVLGTCLGKIMCESSTESKKVKHENDDKCEDRSFPMRLSLRESQIC